LIMLLIVALILSRTLNSFGFLVNNPNRYFKIERPFGPVLHQTDFKGYGKRNRSRNLSRSILLRSHNASSGCMKDPLISALQEKPRN
jgi:hypothetical protein